MTELKNWHDAQDYCQSEFGGLLLELTNHEESEEFHALRLSLGGGDFTNIFIYCCTLNTERWTRDLVTIDDRDNT